MQRPQPSVSVLHTVGAEVEVLSSAATLTVVVKSNAILDSRPQLFGMSLVPLCRVSTLAGRKRDDQHAGERSGFHHSHEKTLTHGSSTVNNPTDSQCLDGPASETLKHNPLRGCRVLTAALNWASGGSATRWTAYPENLGSIPGLALHRCVRDTTEFQNETSGRAHPQHEICHAVRCWAATLEQTPPGSIGHCQTNGKRHSLLDAGNADR
jgi:hypothetical protein